MKITSVEPFILHVPVTGSQIADSTHTISHWGVVGARITTDNGLEGYGFTGTHAHLPSDQLITRCIETCHAPLLVGEDAHDVNRLWLKLARNPALQWVGRAGITTLSHAAIDVALWDLKGKWLNVPVYKLLGGAEQEKINLYRAISQEDSAVMAEKIAGYREQGYTKFQLKVGGEPSDDTARIRLADGRPTRFPDELRATLLALANPEPE